MHRQSLTDRAFPFWMQGRLVQSLDTIPGVYDRKISVIKLWFHFGHLRSVLKSNLCSSCSWLSERAMKQQNEDEEENFWNLYISRNCVTSEIAWRNRYWLRCCVIVACRQWELTFYQTDFQNFHSNCEKFLVTRSLTVVDEIPRKNAQVSTSSVKVKRNAK